MTPLNAAAAGAGAPQLSPALLALLASTCGLMVASIYFGQPLSSLISVDVGLEPESAGLVVTLGQAGYCAGLLLLTPLGDRVENKRLVLATMSCLVAALVAAALARSGATFLLASFAVGLCSTAVQMLVPLAAQMAAPERRGRVIGTMTGGLLLGILLARPVAASVAGYTSWRAVYAAAALVIALFVAVLWRRLPVLRPAPAPGYLRLVASLGSWFARSRTLRRRGLSHAAMFGAFSLFWTSVPWLLAAQGWTQHGIALFSLAGAGGALVAPVVGRLADRGLTRAVSIGAMLLAAAGFASTWRAGPPWGLVVAAIALDAGVQANHVAGQREVLGIDAAARSRLNSVYMGLFFFGGALASAVAGPLFRQAWTAVVLLGTALPLVALAIYLLYD